MATLNSNPSGFQAWGNAPAPAPVRKVETITHRPRCCACRCGIPLTKVRGLALRYEVMEGDDGELCKFCAGYFGVHGMRGATNGDAVSALKRIADVRRDGFVMVLRDLSLAAKDGNVLHLNAADVFPCSPSNPEPDPEALPSKERTWSLFTLWVNVGPYETRLHQHEFASISLRTVMDLKSRGELVESFLSDADKVGHFTPSAEMREQIVATFGRLINAAPTSPPALDDEPTCIPPKIKVVASRKRAKTATKKAKS